MLFARARALPDKSASVGFVGHNPAIGEIAATLAGSGADPELRRMAAKYPTGAVAVHRLSDVDRWDEVEPQDRRCSTCSSPRRELEAETD